MGISRCEADQRRRHQGKSLMKKIYLLVVVSMMTLSAFGESFASLADLPQAKNYVLKRASSYDRSGANADFRTIAPGETLTLLDESGPGLISHIWITIASGDTHH